MRNHNFDPKKLKPKLVNDLVRIGNQFEDGGYVISERLIMMTNTLIGLGINYDWTFESEMKKINPKTRVYCFDFSVSKAIYIKNFISSLINIISVNSYTKEIFNGRSPLSVLSRPFKEWNTYRKFKYFFDSTDGVFFFQKGISNFQSDIFITIPDMVGLISQFHSLPNDSVFVKMDIEQSEYDILEDLLEYKSKINGMAIEFHDLRHYWNDFQDLINIILQDYEIIHLHGNNCCGYIPGTQIPNYVEISFMKRQLFTSQELSLENNQTYPLAGLDKPNINGQPDMSILFA